MVQFLLETSGPYCGKQCRNCLRKIEAKQEERKLKAAANCLREGVGETTTYLLPEFPANHRIKLRTNNMIERLNKEIRRRTRVVGSFPDSNSALMLVCA